MSQTRQARRRAEREESLLTDRWTRLRRHETQQGYYHSRYRFNAVPAGRRSGKTEIAKRRLVRRAMRGSRFDSPRYFAAAPTRDQAKRIYWDDLRKLIPAWMVDGEPSATDLCIPLKNGASVWVVGMDKPERIEGQPWDGGILDEFGNMKAKAWPENVRPALSDRMGWCDLIGVPEGRNHYYDAVKLAQSELAERGAESDWGYFHWKSAEILPASEIAAARRTLDDLTFQQEYEASFVTFTGRAYYPFDDAKHTARLQYNPDAPLIIALDFNVAPGVAVLCQEQMLPGGGLLGTGVIGEVHIQANSNTPAVCRKIIKDWGNHRGLVMLYGDATGGAGGSAKVDGSDWDLVAKHLRPAFPNRLHFRVPAENPRERVRINSMNSRLLSADNSIRMMVDPSKAPNLVKDFEGVRLLVGGSGEIDKKYDRRLTHLTDALGYYVAYEFPIDERKLSTFEFSV